MFRAGRCSIGLCSLLVALVALTSFPAPASAATSSVSTLLEEKQAEKEATLESLQEMRQQLDTQLSRYVMTTRKLAEAKVEISQVTTEIAQQNVKVSEAQQALTMRAVQLYRSDRLGLVRLLFSAESIPQLMDHLSYLEAASRHDAQLIEQVKLARQKSLWLQQNLNERIDLLQQLQVTADEQSVRLSEDMKEQEKKAGQLGEDIALLMRRQAALENVGSTPSGSFSPDTIINETLFRDSGSMTAPDIQAFLEQQPGSLRYQRSRDHNGEMRTAAEMIAEAAVYWRINPKVLLVTLQKEQSLLADATPTARQLDWAMGCGKTDSRTYTKYRGFGTQIWYGAKTLNNNAERFSPGAQLNIDGNIVLPSNSATYSLYKYTPHIHGNLSFWTLYWRYFGDPSLGPTPLAF